MVKLGGIIMPKNKPLNLEFKHLYEFIPFKEVEKLMLKISKEGHSFPHWTTCKTCEDDFEEVVKLTLKYVKQHIKSTINGLLKDIENIENRVIKEKNVDMILMCEEIIKLIRKWFNVCITKT